MAVGGVVDRKDLVLTHQLSHLFVVVTPKVVHEHDERSFGHFGPQMLDPLHEFKVVNGLFKR